MAKANPNPLRPLEVTPNQQKAEIVTQKVEMKVPPLKLKIKEIKRPEEEDPEISFKEPSLVIKSPESEKSPEERIQRPQRLQRPKSPEERLQRAQRLQRPKSPEERIQRPQRLQRPKSPERSPSPEERIPSPKPRVQRPQRMQRPPSPLKRSPSPEERIPSPKPRVQRPQRFQRPPSPMEMLSPEERIPSPEERVPSPEERIPSPPQSLPVARPSSIVEKPLSLDEKPLSLKTFEKPLSLAEKPSSLVEKPSSLIKKPSSPPVFQRPKSPQNGLSEEPELKKPKFEEPLQPLKAKKSIFKSKRKDIKSLYKHSFGSTNEEAKDKAEELKAKVFAKAITAFDDDDFDSGPSVTEMSFSSNKLTKVLDSDEVTSVKCPKKQKEYFTVIKNVKKAHQIQDSGEFQEFNDDVEYILDGLKGQNNLSIRCLSTVTLATKCMEPPFRMHLRAHGTMNKFFAGMSKTQKI